MKIIADFHIHTKYSRATSKDMDLDHLVESARFKGINLLGTGDFTHFLWLEELRHKLSPLKYGLFEYKGINFILTTEVSNIYFQNGRMRRIHNMIFTPTFEIADKINEHLSRYGSLSSDGRPMLGLSAENLVEIVLGISKDCLIVPSHIWTPWFSLFGSESGFDSIEECFGKYTKDIYVLETGLSSDPAMNWRLSSLDRFTLISNSDSHSPSRIGREANVFDATLDYLEILDILKKKDKTRFLFTVEFFPQEGKYHYDGHRNCEIRLSPQETLKFKGICPKCGKHLTIGVMHRVEQLADRGENFSPENAIPFKKMVPLEEIIASARGIGADTQQVKQEYLRIVGHLGTEFDILFELSEKKLYDTLSPQIAEGIMRVRKGILNILPGYDGEYGRVEIFNKEEIDKKEKQRTLF
ncbi:MAG: endonuclease Q family protein [Candidatus Omnitrophica bacterium]|nr:endonuclease Q family protein [Candidatus Omnitrophota bacterium]